MSTLLVVTGASRGLGEAIAVQFAKVLFLETLSSRDDLIKGNHENILRICLVARSSDGLASTTEKIRSQVLDLSSSKTETTAIDSILQISQHYMDLSKLETLDENLDEIISSFYNDDSSSCAGERERDWDRSILINNAANLGHLGNMLDMISLEDFKSSIDFNLTSSAWISQRLLRQFMIPNVKKDGPDKKTRGVTKKKVSIVNISSICAIQPYPTMGVYCTGKAARDMFHSVLAKEVGNVSMTNTSPGQGDEEPKTAIKILNYAPGPLETVMVDELIDCSELDANIHDFMSKSKEENTLINPYDTANLLARLVIVSDDYESGKHVDYWDLKNDEKDSSATQEE